jgi:hypothetical protein
LQRIVEFFTRKIVTKLSKIWVWDPGSEIQDPGSGKNLFRIREPSPGVKKSPDPGSGSATLENTWTGFFNLFISLHIARNFLSRTILFHLGTHLFFISLLLRVRPTFSNWIPLPAVLMVNALSMSDGCALSSRIIHS